MGSFFSRLFLTTLFLRRKPLLMKHFKLFLEKSKMGSFGKNALFFFLSAGAARCRPSVEEAPPRTGKKMGAKR
jgi:hypothetical protein